MNRPDTPENAGSALPPSEPPRRRSALVKWLRGFGLTLLVLATLTALFYAVENYRGWRAWKAERDWLEQHGEPLSWEELAPPPVPDDQNFAAVPLFAALFTAKSGDALRQAQEKAEIKLRPDSFPEEPDLGAWTRGRLTDLRPWVVYFHTAKPVPAWEGEAPPPFPKAPAGASDGEQVFAALTRFQEQFQALEEAAARPACRFPIRYEENFAALLPHLTVLRSHARALVLRAAAHLQSGHTDKALQDFRLAWRTAEVLRHEPVLISALVRVVNHHFAVQILWEGLATHRWSSGEIAAIDGWLAQDNFLADGLHALRGERLFGLEGLDLLRQGRMPLEAVSGPNARPVASLGRAIPDGWFWQNMVCLSRFHRDLWGGRIDTNRLRVDWTGSREAAKKWEETPMTPYNWAVKLLAPAIDKAMGRFGEGQAVVHLARTGCALEQHRLRTGAFPGSLEDMGEVRPEWTDPFDGRPLRYHLEGPDAYTLYSIGRDRQDDGGVPQGAVDQRDSSRGDLVWRIPARPASAE